LINAADILQQAVLTQLPFLAVFVRVRFHSICKKKSGWTDVLASEEILAASTVGQLFLSRCSYHSESCQHYCHTVHYL